MLFVDVGGIDMALGFLLLYYKPLTLRLQKKLDFLNETLSITKNLILNSTLMKPKIFLMQTTFSTAVMVITGSLLFSLGFILPALLVNGTII